MGNFRATASLSTRVMHCATILSVVGWQMATFLIEGCQEVLRGPGAAMKLFWPVALAYLMAMVIGAVLGFFAAAESPVGAVALLLAGIIAAVYSFLAFCQGAVGWHRRMLLNEAADWISPIPRLRGLRYALAVFVFCLIYLIGHLFISTYTLPYLHSVFTSELDGIDLTNAPVDQLEIWRKAVWPIQVATLVSAIILAAAILWFGRFWLLIFPHISIRSLNPTFEQIRTNLSHPAGLVCGLLFIYFLPFFLGTVYYAITPMSVQLMPAVRIPYVVLSITLTIFCFLWGLSMLSIAYRQAEHDLPREATDTAQA